MFPARYCSVSELPVVSSRRCFHRVFLHVVACCPTPTPGPLQVPCPGSRGTAGPHKRKSPEGQFQGGTWRSFPERGLCEPVLRRVASSPPPGPPYRGRSSGPAAPASHSLSLALSLALSLSLSLPPPSRVFRVGKV